MSPRRLDDFSTASDVAAVARRGVRLLEALDWDPGRASAATPVGSHRATILENAAINLETAARAARDAATSCRRLESGERLRREGAGAAKFRGHRLGLWRTLDALSWAAECRTCGAEVVVSTEPAPNGVDVGGEAVALNCRPRPSRERRFTSTGHACACVGCDAEPQGLCLSGAKPRGGR